MFKNEQICTDRHGICESNEVCYCDKEECTKCGQLYYSELGCKCSVKFMPPSDIGELLDNKK